MTRVTFDRGHAQTALHAEVVTALPLDGEDKEWLSRQLEEIVGHKVMIDAKVDPSIIGGFKAKIGDMLIDGSIRSKLEALRKSLVEARGDEH